MRAVCEAARTPLHEDGLLGHLANVVLLLPEELLLQEQVDYAEAQRRGQQLGDCQSYVHGCATSIFQVRGDFFLLLLIRIG